MTKSTSTYFMAIWRTSEHGKSRKGKWGKKVQTIVPSVWYMYRQRKRNIALRAPLNYHFTLLYSSSDSQVMMMLVNDFCKKVTENKSFIWSLNFISSNFLHWTLSMLEWISRKQMLIFFCSSYYLLQYCT